MTKLSSGQKETVVEIIEWFMAGVRSPKSFFLSGYAGTGKSTVITTVIKELIKKIPNIKVEGSILKNIHVACPTGKAVNVIQDNLRKEDSLMYNIDVSTIHSFAFYPKTHVNREVITKSKLKEYQRRKKKNMRVVFESDTDDTVIIETEHVTFSKKEEDKVEVVDLLIVDEASMLTLKMHRDIIDYDIKILFVGDIAQLPPVDNNFKKVDILGEPDAQLTEIFRQEKGNAIRDLSEDIRNGIPLKVGTYGENNEVKIISRDQFMNDVELRRQIYLHADQIICGRNDTRRFLNQEVRTVKGFTGKIPMVGEKVICLKNHKNIRIGGVELVNGLMGEVVDVDTFMISESSQDEQIFDMRFRPEGVKDKYYQDLNVSTLAFTEEKVSGAHMHKSPHAFFDFGYAVTCHKSQGSEWDNVLVIEEMLNSDTHLNWLYTAITRAQKGLIVVI